MIDSNSYFIVFILCLQTLYNCTLSIVGQYIYGYFLQTYPISYRNWTNISSVSYTIDSVGLDQEQCTDLSNNSAQAWAQQHSADLIFQTTLWRAFPVIIVTYLFGVYASQINRRLVLILSIFGNAVHVGIYLAIIYKHLPEYWWNISASIAGLAGGTNVIGIVVNLIITESTDENDRSARFVRLGAMNTGLSAVAIFGIGYYIQWRGFTDLFWMALGFELLSIFVVIFFMKATHSPSSIDESTSLLSSNNVNVEIKSPVISKCYRCFDICTVFSFKHRSPKKSISLILIIIAYVFHLLALSSMSPLLWYLLGAPFCWSSKNLGNYSAVSLITTAIFSVLGMKVLSRCGANDAIICALGHICFFGCSLWIALAQHSWQLYLALSINPFSSYQSALTVPMISKLLEVHERTNIFTLVTEVNTIILAFGSSLFNWVYARTVTYQKNFTLLFASGLCIVPFIINLFLFVITRRIADEQESSSISDITAEPPLLSLMTNVPPQATDVVCLLVTSRSRSNSLCVSHDIRSRTNSHSSIDGQSISTSNPMIL